MKNVIVGNTSQLSYYFPSDYLRISSRDFYKYSDKTSSFDTVYIVFGENRTFLPDQLPNIFEEINYEYTIKCIEHFWVVQSTLLSMELQKCGIYTGPININTPKSHVKSQYIDSKSKLLDKITENAKYDSVSAIIPFNFNGRFRKGDYLFGKVLIRSRQNLKLHFAIPTSFVISRSHLLLLTRA